MFFISEFEYREFAYWELFLDTIILIFKDLLQHNKQNYLRNKIQYSFSCRIPHYKGELWAGIHSLKDITSAEGQRNERKFEKKDVAIYESNLQYLVPTYLI